MMLEIGGLGLAPKNFEIVSSETSKNALLQAEMFLFSSLEFMLRRINWFHRILKI